MNYIIEVEDIIVPLFTAYRVKALHLSRIYMFVAYIKKKIREREEDAQIFVNIDGYIIERLVSFNDLVYDLQGDILIIKGILPTITDKYKLNGIAKEFVGEHPYK